MGNRKNLPHHEELTRQPVTKKNQFTEKKLLRPFLKDWCEQAAQSAIGQMRKMAKTLRTHASGIRAYARHPITSGKLDHVSS
jgi:transposase